MPKLWFWLRLCVYCFIEYSFRSWKWNPAPGRGRKTTYSAKRTHPSHSYTLKNDGHMWFCDKPHPKSDCSSQKGFSAEKERKRRSIHTLKMSTEQIVWWIAKIYQCLQPEKDKKQVRKLCQLGQKTCCVLSNKMDLKIFGSWAHPRNISDNLCPLSSSRTSFKRKPCFSAHRLGNSFST